jgi:hypothetical protein
MATGAEMGNAEKELVCDELVPSPCPPHALDAECDLPELLPPREKDAHEWVFAVNWAARDCIVDLGICVGSSWGQTKTERMHTKKVDKRRRCRDIEPKGGPDAAISRSSERRQVG